MIAAAMLMLLLGTPVAITLEESTGLSPEESRELVDRLGEAIASVQRGAGPERLSIRLLGGLRRIRMVITSPELARAAEPGARLERDLPRDSAQWPPLLREIAASLYPAPTESPARPESNLANVASAKPPAAERSSRLPGWILAGASAACLGIGVALGVNADNVRRAALASPVSDADYASVNGRHKSEAIAASVLIDGGAILAALSVLLFVTQ